MTKEEILYSIRGFIQIIVFTALFIIAVMVADYFIGDALTPEINAGPEWEQALWTLFH